MVRAVSTRRRRGSSVPRRSFPRSRVIWAGAAALAVAVAVTAVSIARFGGAPERTDVLFSEFLQQIEAGTVAEVTVASDLLLFDRKDGGKLQTVPPPGYVAANPTFVSALNARGVRLGVQRHTTSAASSYGAIALGLVLIGAAGFAFYRVVHGRVPMLEKARAIDPEDVTVTFADVAGVDEAKDEVREIVDFLKAPERFASIGGRIPRGILLVGPPGTGKTLLARSMAGEASVPFMSVSGSDFVEMDGFSPSDSIIVVAATNRQDILDPALLRPGRFDRQVIVGNPDQRGREQILKVHARKIVLEDDVELRTIARGTPGFSGADLANLVNEAALIAVRAGRRTVGNDDFDAARDKVLMGAERKSVTMSDRERTTCAYHEAGHAVVAAILPDADPLHKVTIIPRGRALGVTMQLPEADRYTHSKPFIEAQIAILMGGRVAEELFLRQATSGASNDIERATELARKMVCELGMSQMGPLHYRRPSSAFESDGRAAGFSEETARRVDDEIRTLVMRGYETARQVIERQRAAVENLAQELLEFESVDADRMKEIMVASQGAAIN